MTPGLLGLAKPLPPVEGGEDPDNPLIPSTTLSRATSSPFPTDKQERKDDGIDQVLLEEEEYEVATIGLLPSGYSESHGVHSHSPPSTPFANVGGLKSLVCEQAAGDGDQSYSGSFKWMSSKMRLMVSSDRMVDDKPNRRGETVQIQQDKPNRRGETVQIQQKSPPFDDDDLSNNINGSPNTKIRICSDCNTTKTPLWRSGPQGPKSLCNACGIRQRKARRAVAAAAANGGLLSVQTSMTSSSNNKMSKEKIRSGSKNYPTQYRKKFKLGTPRSRKKILFDEFMISLSKNSTFHQVFPQDEKEAAILLMALSCGLVRG